MFRLLFCLIFAATLLNGCTIEKRLYTKGWSMELHRRYSPSPAEKENQVADAVNAPVEPIETGIRIEKPAIALQAIQTVPDSISVDALPAKASETIFLSEGKEVTDTFFVDEEDLPKPKKMWTWQKKKNAIILTSTLLFFTGLAILLLALLLPEAAMEIALTIVLAVCALVILAAILLILLLIFALKKVPDRPEKLPASKRGSRRTRVVLWILFSMVIVAGIFAAYQQVNL